MTTKGSWISLTVGLLSAPLTALAEPRRPMKRMLLPSAMLVTIAVLSLLLTTPHLSAAPRQLGPPYPEVHLFLERFDEAYQLAANQIDPSVFVPSWSGYALNRQAGAALMPWTVPMVGLSGSWQVPPRAGAVRVWYMPSFTSVSLGGNGPGNPATLLSLVTTNGDANLTWWSLVISADGNSIQLQCPACNSESPCFTAPVSFKSGGWTLLTVGWTTTNSAMWWNDQIIATGTGIPAVSAEAASFTSLVVGSDAYGQTPASGLMDLLTTFSADAVSRKAPPTPFGLDPVRNLTAYGNSLAATTLLGPVSDAAQMRMSAMTLSAATTDSSLFPIFNTNSLPQRRVYRPTSTNGLQQVFSWPKLGTYWSLQKTNSPPYPFDPCPTCNVYVVDATNNIYVVDDLAYAYPVSTNSYEPQSATPMNVANYPPGTLYLTITATNSGFATVFLHNTTNGQNYTLQSTESLAGSNVTWLVEQDVIGADDVTTVQVPLFGRQQLFFQAHTGTDDGPRVLFVQITGITANTVSLKLYSTAAGQTYNIDTRQFLTDTGWVSQDPFTGLTNWTPTTISMDTETSGFMRARCWQDTSGSGFPDWWAERYFGVPRRL